MLISPHDESVSTDRVNDATRASGSTMWRTGRFVLQFVLMLAILVGSYVVMTMVIAARPERVPNPITPTVYAVAAQDVVIEDHRPDILAYGDVVAQRTVDLRAQVTGEIIEVNPQLRAGQRIEQGDFLARIDPFVYEGQLTEARASLAQAQAVLSEIDARIAAEREQQQSAELQLEIAESDLLRAQSLSDRGAGTQQQLDERRLVVSQRSQAVSQSRNTLLVEEARRNQQQAEIERQEWLVRQAERALSNTTLTAPFAGVISEAIAEPGRIAGSADIIASIYDDRLLEARFTLTDAQYGRISSDGEPLIGRAVEASWVVGTETYRYEGTIDRLGATVASDRGGVEVFARLAPADHAVQLRPGAFVALSVPDRLYADTIELPGSAVYDPGHAYVIEEGVLRRREVTVLAYQGDTILLRGDLQPGERVLTTRLTEADEGLAVRIAGEASDTDPAAEAVEPAGERSGGRRPGGRGAMRAFGG
jgi:RND family efflux transporter MFP subunit